MRISIANSVTFGCNNNNKPSQDTGGTDKLSASSGPNVVCSAPSFALSLLRIADPFTSCLDVLSFGSRLASSTAVPCHGSAFLSPRSQRSAPVGAQLLLCSLLSRLYSSPPLLPQQRCLRHHCPPSFVSSPREAGHCGDPPA